MISKRENKYLEVKAARGSYGASLGRIVDFDKKTEKGKRFFIVDKNILRLYPGIKKKIGREPLFAFTATENNKSLEYAVKNILPWLVSQRVTRSSVVVAIGGGITQDVTGFACSLWLRGVPWLFYPTTLLAQADSCIGSKTSINYKQAKNILGTFYPPIEIVIDRTVLSTLGDLDFRSGVGEIIKVHLLQSQVDVGRLKENIGEVLERKPAQLEEAIRRSLLIKKRLIEKDEFDMGVRNILNYGHCFGHALEAAVKYRIPHGLAVVYGMAVANRISRIMGLLSEAEEVQMQELIARNFSLQNEARNAQLKKILPYMRKDKKNVGGNISVILTRGVGKMEKVVGVKPLAVKRAWRDIVKEL
jgi:3-dehydroquinate synthase